MKGLKQMFKRYTPWFVVGLIIVLLAAQAYTGQVTAQLEDVTNLNGLHITNSSFGTATPSLMVNSSGAGVLFQVRDASTPVFSVNDGGGVTMTGSFSPSGGQSVSPNLVVSAPTAIATATPGLYINNAGAHNSLVIAKNATPNFTVGNSGTITGLVLQYGASGKKQVCGTTTITGTGNIPTTLATPEYILLTLAEDVTGDHAHVSYANAAATVTAKVWNSAATPAASSVGASVAWCAIGTP